MKNGWFFYSFLALALIPEIGLANESAISTVHIKADIIGESCRAITLESSDYYYDLGKFSTTEINNRLFVSPSSRITQNVDVPIEFKCSEGTYANFRIYGDTSQQCLIKGNPNPTYNLFCSGPNKSVGISTVFKYQNRDGVTSNMAFFNTINGKTSTKNIKLNDEKVGILTMTEIRLHAVDGYSAAEPGKIEGNVLIEMWEP